MTDEYFITQSDNLIRRYFIAPKYEDNFFKIIDGVKKPTSAAFKTKPDENGLSVDISSLTTPEKSILDPEKFALAEFSAQIPLSNNFDCVHDPMPGNYAHALVLGDTKRIAKILATQSKLIFLT